MIWIAFGKILSFMLFFVVHEEDVLGLFLDVFFSQAG